MIGFFRAIGRVIGWLWRTRALRPVFVFALLLWLVDGVVTLATDAAWFASIGMSPLWKAQFAWKAGIETAFIALGLLGSVPLMRAAARPVAGEMEAPPLPRGLERWQPLRGKAMHLSWLLLLGAAVFIGQGLSLRWSEFALASSRWAPTGTGESADFWLVRAPALQSALAALWAWMLVVSAVVLGAGALRSLPFLAARPSVVPVRWLRALWWVGAALCALRGLGFVFEAMCHAQIANDSGAARTGFVILNGLGALGCAGVLALSRHPRPTLALWVTAVLILPLLGGDLLSPFVGHSSLAPPMPATLNVSTHPPDDWPQWDEAALLRAARLLLSNRGKEDHLIEWQRAGISPQKGEGSRADIVASPIEGDEWAGHGLADREGALAWQSFELAQQRAAPVASPLGPLFYGLKARPLLSTETREGGVPFQEWPWKLAWAWRLRDPLLLIEGAQSRRLLVVRGAREVGQKLAPFWTWDDVVPRRDPRTGHAYFECVAYASSDRLPRTAPFESGMFAGQNGAVPVAVLRLDARSGAVRLSPFPSSPLSSPPGSLGARWETALPTLFGSNAPERAPTPALEVAFSAGSSLVWVGGAAGWQKKAVPPEWRMALQEKLDQFDGTARVNSQVHLEGATPLLWREKGKLFLAQAFFDFATANRVGLVANNAELPSAAGVVAGPLKGQGARWGASFEDARAGVGLPEDSVPPLAPAQIPVRDIAQKAQEARRHATAALKSGHYVESEKQLGRVDALLEELKRRTR